jgi:hypothetical protein
MNKCPGDAASWYRTRTVAPSNSINVVTAYSQRRALDVGAMNRTSAQGSSRRARVAADMAALPSLPAAGTDVKPKAHPNARRPRPRDSRVSGGTAAAREEQPGSVLRPGATAPFGPGEAPDNSPPASISQRPCAPAPCGQSNPSLVASPMAICRRRREPCRTSAPRCKAPAEGSAPQAPGRIRLLAVPRSAAPLLPRRPFPWTIGGKSTKETGKRGIR